MGFADPGGFRLKGIQVKMKWEAVERFSREVVVGQRLESFYLVLLRKILGVDLISHYAL
jgi:hypothetical protein